MKLLFSLLIMLMPFAARSEIYKCEIKGKMVYQSKPCPDKGEEFKLKPDITPERQQAAKAVLEAELAEREAQRLQMQEQIDKERAIRAEESKARAILRRAREEARQADALEKRNIIEMKKGYRQFWTRHSPKTPPPVFLHQPTISPPSTTTMPPK